MKIGHDALAHIRRERFGQVAGKDVACARLAPLTRFALVSVLLASTGCAQYQVRVPDSDPLRETYRTQRMNAYFWGLSNDPEVLAADCEGQGVNDVVVAHTFADSLIGVLTLGVWLPTEMRFRCKAPPIAGGDFPALDGAPTQ